MTKQAQPQTTDFAVSVSTAAEATKDNSTKLLQSVIAADAAPLTPAEMAKAIAGLQQQAHGAAPLDGLDTAKNPADDGTNVDTLPRINFADLTAPAWTTDPLGFAINADAAPAEIDTWGLLGGRPALPRRGVVMINAKRKQGKSFAALALAVALLGDTEQFGNFAPVAPRPNGIIIADTEMSATTLQRRHLGVINTIGEAARRRLITLQLTKCTRAERWDVLQKYVAIYDPQIVVVDNLTNMLPNVNDQEASTAICDQLDEMGKDRTIIAVIHQNKSAEDTNATGAIGTKLSNMAVESYTAKRQNGVFWLLPVDARDTEIPEDDADRKLLALTYGVAKDDDNPLNIAKFVDGRPAADRAAEEQTEKWRIHFAAIFGDADTLTRAEMHRRLIDKYGYRDTAAEEAIRNATKAGVIAKTGTGHKDPYKMADISTAANASDYAQ